jgi:RNA polymerase sigma factor (TIGR02999 family)
LSAVLPVVYDELRNIAHSYLRNYRPGHTLQSTALVHEAYLRLKKQDAGQFANRAHFVAISAQLMRQILVEYGRRRRTAKRDGGERLMLEDALQLGHGKCMDVVSLDDALEELTKLDARQSQIVEMRFFGGLSIEETADVGGNLSSHRKREWLPRGCGCTASLVGRRIHDPERWRQIKAILEDAGDSAAGTARISIACSDDAEMRKELDSLLKSNEEVRSGFLHSTIPPVTLIRGSRIGEYEVRTLVGSGGMGEVYRARDTRLDRDVAIKVLPAYLSSDRDRLRRFEQEAQATAALNHPNILSVFQFGSFEGAPYLVTELLDGETLRELIRRGPIAQRKAIDLATQIAQGLAAAHGKGIVHRDLKPENIFITRDGRIKILDFGLAKLIGLEPRHNVLTSADTEPGMIMGTASYMAPEQVRGQAADNRSDIFAFGTIMYEMLSGKRAFRRETSADTMSAILKEDRLPLPETLSPALSRIVRRCLEKNPEQRFQSASDLGFALEAITTMSDTSTAQFVAKPRRRWPIVVGGLLVVAGLLAAVLWLGKSLPSNHNVSR